MGRESCMPLWYGDFLTSTNEWPGEACSLYLTALAQQWVSPSRSLPADPVSLRSVLRWSESTFERYWPIVAVKFELQGDRLVNRRCEEHRESTVERTQKLSESGRRGAEKRWHPNGQQDGPANGLAKKNGGKANGPAKKKRSEANGVATKNGGEANGEANGLAIKRPMPPTSPTSPLQSEEFRARSGSETESGGEPPAIEDEDRARNPKNGEPESEIRRKALLALSRGLDAPTVAKAFKVRVAQVREWQQQEVA